MNLRFSQLGLLLRRLRDERGLSQRDYADALGVVVPKGPPVVRHKPDVIEAVRSMREDGHAFGAIGEALDLTRSTVAGIVARHCADGVPKVVRPKRKREPIEKVEAPKPIEVVEVAASVVPTFRIVSNPVPFSAARGCRWPLWSNDDAFADKTVCGASCGTDTYCAGHAALAYRVPEKRRAA